MHLNMLLEMVSGGLDDRVLFGTQSDGVTAADLAAGARRVGAWLEAQPGNAVGFVDLNSEALPLTLFGCGVAGKAFVPCNYRLTDEQLRSLLVRIAPATVIVGDTTHDRLRGIDGVRLVHRSELLAVAAAPPAPEADLVVGDPDEIAVLLYTSGTTGEPKAAVLRHRNLAAYILSSVEYASAGGAECAIVSVPPYHIAGVSSVLSSSFAGRRVVYVEAFDAAEWVRLARAESVTHAMVVPTMLSRILDALEDGRGLPALRTLSYGGGPMPLPVIERALRMLPDVGFVNAYGLTETSSTIALLGPDDHRAAMESEDPEVRARLGSVGRPLPTLEVSIRDLDGWPLPPGERGEICVRGEQVSGEYLGRTAGPDDGWFRTRDGGHLDAGGYLFVHGRLDDVIVRGGENLSPGEIEQVLAEHPAVLAAGVVGIPDEDWGEQVVAAVALADGRITSEEELRQFVQARLRSAKTPTHIQIRDELPFNEMGKLLRRVLRSELTEAYG